MTEFSTETYGQGDTFLFHYTTAEALALILDSGRFNLSKLDRMNDPREKKPIQLGYRGEMVSPYRMPTAETMARIDEAFQAVRNSIYVGCFTVENEDSGPDAYFARGWSRARNWAQYGGNHKGVCLVVRTEVVLEDLRSWSSATSFECGLVKYADKSAGVGEDTDPWPALPYIDITTDDDEHERQFRDMLHSRYEPLFFTKNMDWQSEKEYRVVLEATEPPSFDIKHSLAAILLGEDYAPAEVNVLSARLRRCNVESVHLGRLLWRNGAPGTVWLTPNDVPGMELSPVVDAMRPVR